MLTYCLGCKENIKNIDSKMVETKNGTLALYQNVLYVIVRSLDLLKSNKQKDCYLT